MSNTTLKITGGTLRSRTISYIKKSKIKPTKSYIREVIFNTININNEMRVLDLFSGSGILSLEAISRGVMSSTMVDKDYLACEHVKHEFDKLEVKNYILYNHDVINYIENNNKPRFDIIFLDAPYDTNLLEISIELLSKKNYFDNNSYIYFEQHKKDYNQKLVSMISNTHNIVKDSNIGDVNYIIALKR